MNGMTHDQVQRFEADLKRRRDMRVRLAAEAEKAGKFTHKMVHEAHRDELDTCLYLLHLYSDRIYGEPTGAEGGEQ